MERRRREERELDKVVEKSYLLGVSKSRVEKLAESLGVTKLCKSQVSVMAAELDEMVASFRSRPLDAGPYAFVWIDALTQKVREGGRTVNEHALIATGVNADGKREILGLDVASAEEARGGWRSCAACPPAACPGCSWSPPTATTGSGTRSPRCCPARPGKGAGRTTPGIWRRRCLSRRSRGCRRWSGPPSSSPKPLGACPARPGGHALEAKSRPRRGTWMTPATTSRGSPRSAGRSGARCGAINRRNA